MAIHSSVLAWKIPWTEKSSGLHSMELQRAGYAPCQAGPQGRRVPTMNSDRQLSLLADRSNRASELVQEFGLLIL